MSIYIQGMDMPTRCGECKMHFLGSPDYVCCSITDRIPKIVGEYHNSRIDLGARRESIMAVDRPDWCPLVEVPEHGRLIDADNMGIYAKEILAIEEYKANPNNEYFEGVKDGLHIAAKCLSIAPTIIPADPAKDGER